MVCDRWMIERMQECGSWVIFYIRNWVDIFFIYLIGRVGKGVGLQENLVRGSGKLGFVFVVFEEFLGNFCRKSIWL